MSDKLIFLGDSEIILRSPFVREEVQALKTTVPNARWDRLAQVWRIPVLDREEAIEFANTWEYTVTDELVRLPLPKKSTASSSVFMDGNGIIIRFPYDPVKLKAVKKLPGARWIPDERRWRLPSSMLSKSIAFANEYGLEVSQDLIDESERLEAQRQKEIDLSRATEGTIKIPTLQLELRLYQRAGVEYALNHRKCFIADEMGLGKTLQSLAAVEAADAYPCLIVTPAKLPLDWNMKIREALPHRSTTVITGRKDFPEIDGDFTIIGNSNISHHVAGLVKQKYASLILDESQAFKNNKAQRTKAAKKISKSIQRDGLVLLLTGTPLENRLSEYGTQLDLIGKVQQFGGLWGFYKSFCGAFKDQYGRWQKDGSISQDKIKELNDMLRQDCFVRRLKKQVLQDLPEIIEDVVYVDMEDKWRKEYEKAVANIVEYFVEERARIAEELGENASAAKIRARIAANAAEYMIKISVLRRITAKAKIEAANEWLEQRKEEGNKVVVGAHHRDVTTALSNANGGLKIIGGQSLTSVEEDKATFQTKTCDEAPVIVLSVQAAKTGHTLHAAAHTLLVEQPWSPSDVDQFVARTHRIGQKRTVQATTMLCPDTIDIDIHELLKKKKKIVDMGTDGVITSAEESVVMALIDKFLEDQ